MIDCEQSNIHLGTTAIGSADRAPDDEKDLNIFEMRIFSLNSIRNFQEPKDFDFHPFEW